MAVPETIAAHIEQAIGRPFRIRQQHALGGGCISSAFKLEGDDSSFFVKTHHAENIQMFEAEAQGLREIDDSNTLRVPRPICCGSEGDIAFLVLEFLELGGGNGTAMSDFGAQFANMHKTTAARFGWDIDNTIGSTPQINTASDNWVEFLRDRRLGFQFSLAGQRGFGGTLQRNGEQLLGSLDAFFTDYQPVPSLLHGDLWSGNYAIDRQGRAVIFDPAVYYGDREADLAMTELFGGFGQRFYAAYQESFPLDAGYRLRKGLYNLYHILNHLNLFGNGYLSQAENMTSRLLGEIR